MRGYVAAVLSTIFFASAGQAAQILDQSNIAQPAPVIGQPHGESILNDVRVSPSNSLIDTAALQFVTAGVSGQLTQVDLQLGSLGANFGPIGFGKLVVGKELTFNPDGTIADGTLLGELGFVVAPGTSLNNFMSIDTSSLDITLDSGEQFVIAVLPDQGDFTAFFWAFSGDAYAGGNGFSGIRPGEPDGDDYIWLTASPQYVTKDYGFRTWMSAVPEPESWAMMIVGFGMAGAALRRRNSRVALA
jgi:hypothetical protein